MKRLALVAALGAATTAHAKPAPRSPAAPLVEFRGVPVPIGDDAVRSAREFLRDRMRVEAELVLASDRMQAGTEARPTIRTIAFRQRVDGLEVIGGTAVVTISRGRIFAAIATVYPRAVATRAFRGATAVVATRDGFRAVRRRGEDFVDDEGAVQLHVPDRRDASGTLVFDVGERNPAQRRSAPANTASILVDGAPTVTDTLGVFTWPTNVASTVAPSTSGPFVEVTSADAVPPGGTVIIAPDGTGTWSFAADEKRDAQLAAFIYASDARAAARAIAPLPYLEDPLPVEVNRVDASVSCNAYASGDSLAFFTRDATCENTARIADIVHHEFGHTFHRNGIIDGAGAFDPDLSEGLADYFAATMVGDTALGRGMFLADDAPLRDIAPDNRVYLFPDDLSADPHHSGFIISGALWDLRRDVGAAVADPIFYGVVQRAPSIQASYTAALIADDDDANLANGTPHICALGKAFALHGLATFSTTTIGTPVVAGDSITVPVSLGTEPGCTAPTVTGVVLRVNGGAEQPLVADGTSFAGTLPALPIDQVSTYVIRATMSDGRIVQFPQSNADPAYQIFAGTPVPIMCASMDDDPHWPSSPAGVWQHGRPDAPHPDPLSTHTGTKVLGTVVHDNGRYADSASSRIDTPAIAVDPAKFHAVHLQYWRWLSVEDSKYDRATIEVNGTTVWTNATDRVGTRDHVDREWRFHDLDITPQITNGTASIAWTLVTDSSGTLGGWSLDDVCIVGVGPLDEPGGDVTEPTTPPGCCDIGGDPTTSLFGIALVTLVVRRRRRM